MTEHLETMPRPETAPCPDWVDAEPFRAHVRDLICETGLSWRLVAAHAGVAPRAVRSLLHGRRGYTLHRLHVSIARALTTTSIESIDADQHLVTDATTTRQLLADLRTVGHGPDLARHLQPDDLTQLDDPQGLALQPGHPPPASPPATTSSPPPHVQPPPAHVRSPA